MCVVFVVSVCVCVWFVSVCVCVVFNDVVVDSVLLNLCVVR